MQTAEGKELADLMARGDNREAKRKALALLGSPDSSADVRADAGKVLRALKPDPMALVLVLVAAVGLILVFVSYVGAH